MRPYDIKSRIVKWRSLLIIGALISLCLSDSVGPRLLPLPVLQVVTASPGGQQGIEPTASRVPSPTKGSSPRVEMAAAPQNRASGGHQHVQVATHAPTGVFEAPAYIILGVTATYEPLCSFSSPATRPPGRAPPRLI